jgi:hypothetical protein
MRRVRQRHRVASPGSLSRGAAPEPTTKDIVPAKAEAETARPIVRERKDGAPAKSLPAAERRSMAHKFKVGDHVSWNSEAGRVRGRIIKVHMTNVRYKGYTHHATSADPQYAIKSDKTDHIALHKGGALRRLAR